MALTVKVKTLESKVYDFQVDGNITIQAFKELIANQVNVSADKQRLIFCGRVLNENDKKLTELNIKSGQVLHLVQKPPALTNDQQNSRRENASQSNDHHHDDGIFVGAFAIPQETFDANGLQRVVENVMSGIGELGRNATVMSHTSEDGSSVDVHINLGATSIQHEIHERFATAHRIIRYINRILDDLESNSISNENRDLAQPTSSQAAIHLNENPASTITSNIQNGQSNQRTQSPQQRRTLTSQGFLEFLNAEIDNMMSASSRAFRFRSYPSSNSEETNQRSGSNVTSVGSNVTNDGSNTTNDGSNTTNDGSNTTNDGSRSNGNEQNQHERITFSPRRRHPAGDSSRRIPASELGNLLTTIQTIQDRFKRHLQRYHQLISNEGEMNSSDLTDAQRFQRNILRLTHHLSHVNHLVSDLSIDFTSKTVRLAPSYHGFPSMPFVMPSSRMSQSIRRETNPQTANRNPTNTSNNNNTSSSSSNFVTVGSTTNSTNSVPRFSQSNANSQSNSVFVAQGPIVFMEVGSSNAERTSSGEPASGEPASGETPSRNQQTSTSTSTIPSIFNTTSSLSRNIMSSLPDFLFSSHQSTFDPYLRCDSHFTIPEIRTRISVGISSHRRNINDLRQQTIQNQQTNNSQNGLVENSASQVNNHPIVNENYNETWHSSVPQNWVPIISDDIQNQRRQTRPLSDAYVNGPSQVKRRKIENDKRSIANYTDSSAFHDSLKSAIVVAGVHPKSSRSQEEILKEADSDSNLQIAFKQQLKCEINNRVSNDSDYNPVRFFNTNTYINS